MLLNTFCVIFSSYQSSWPRLFERSNTTLAPQTRSFCVLSANANIGPKNLDNNIIRPGHFRANTNIFYIPSPPQLLCKYTKFKLTNTKLNQLELDFFSLILLSIRDVSAGDLCEDSPLLFVMAFMDMESYTAKLLLEVEPRLGRSKQIWSGHYFKHRRIACSFYVTIQGVLKWWFVLLCFFLGID